MSNYNYVETVNSNLVRYPVYSNCTFAHMVSLSDMLRLSVSLGTRPNDTSEHV